MKFKAKPKGAKRLIKLSPNSKCPCGSGKKIKKCHGPEILKNE